MGINLLPHAEEYVQEDVKKEVTAYVVAGVWFGIVVLLTSGLFLYKALMQKRLEDALAARTKVMNDLENISPVVDTYYNIAYKSMVLEYVNRKKYKPSVVKKYIQQQVGGFGHVTSYYINAEGEIKIGIDAEDYVKAVHIWHSLLQNRNIIEELSLNAFSADKNGAVTFVLKGKLNLPKLYQLYESNQE